MRTVEVFADVLCPFTHVGLRALVDRCGNRGLIEPRLRIRAWPLELINGKPLDSHHVGAEILVLRASVCPDLFAGFSVDTFRGTSMAAFALTAVADRVGLEPLDAETRSATLHADWDEGRTRGVMGSPHFFTGDGGSWFCPGLDISRDNLGNFVIAWKQGTEAFVESVFG